MDDPKHPWFEHDLKMQEILWIMKKKKKLLLWKKGLFPRNPAANDDLEANKVAKTKEM